MWRVFMGEGLGADRHAPARGGGWEGTADGRECETPSPEEPAKFHGSRRCGATFARRLLGRRTQRERPGLAHIERYANNSEYLRNGESHVGTAPIQALGRAAPRVTHQRRRDAVGAVSCVRVRRASS